jgi:anti-sigma factor RsiW
MWFRFVRVPGEPSMVTCDDMLRESLDLLVDGELADTELGEVLAHVEQCASCRDALERRESTKRALARLGDESRCSEGFHARLADALAAESGPIAAPVRRGPVIVRSLQRWFAAAAVTVGLAGVGFAVGFWMPALSGAGGADVVASDAYDDPNGPPPLIVDESIRWHARQVPVEVAGPDRAAVGAWFADKVAFPVDPPALAPRAHLIGGRLGNVERSEAAFLLYDLDGTKVSVMVFDPQLTALPRLRGVRGGEVYVRDANGYAVAVEERNGIGYSYTTQLPREELAELVGASYTLR